MPSLSLPVTGDFRNPPRRGIPRTAAALVRMAERR